jgi:hypothetical protein
MAARWTGRRQSDSQWKPATQPDDDWHDAKPCHPNGQLNGASAIKSGDAEAHRSPAWEWMKGAPAERASASQEEKQRSPGRLADLRLSLAMPLVIYADLDGAARRMWPALILT